MGEVIRRIQELVDFKGYPCDPERKYPGSWDGYEVQTNQQLMRFLIENDTQCCENWGYLWSNDSPQEFIGAALLGVSLTDTGLQTKAIEQAYEAESGDGEAANIMFVNIETDRGLLQFVAYNAHNGFYGHDVLIDCQQLKHKGEL